MFGSYKPLHEVGGRPLISRVIDEVRKISQEVIVSVRDEKQRRGIEEVVEVDFIVDEDLPCPGPVRGILTSVQRLPAMVIPADLPWVEGRALLELQERCLHFSRSFDVCGFTWARRSSRELESAILILNSREPLNLVRRACGIKRTRVTDIHRAAEGHVLIGAGLLGEAWRLADLDLPTGSPPRGGEWEPEVLIYLKGAVGHPYRSLINYLESSDVEGAIHSLRVEMGIYEEVSTIEAHIRRDLDLLMSE